MGKIAEMITMKGEGTRQCGPRKGMKRKTLIALMAVMLLVLPMAGCGGGADENGEVRTDLKVAVDCDADSLAPWDTILSTTYITRTMLFDPLFYYDTESKELKYYIAEDHQVSNDGLTYTFKLKEGIQFSDGTELTADDVVFTANQYKVSYKQSVYMESVDTVTAVDDYTVEFVLKYPYSPFLIDVSNLYIASEKAFEEMGQEEFAKNPVGSGQYTLEEWKSAVSLRFVKNENYSDGDVTMDAVELVVMTDANARATALESGDVDVASIDVASVKNLETIDTLEIVECPSTKNCLISMNLTQDIFKDVKVREAISYAMNRAYIVEATQQGFATPTSIFYPSSVFGYSENVTTYDYDPEKAKELLKEAGITTPYDLGTLTCNESGSTVAEIVQQQLKEIGLDMKIQILETSTFYDQIYKANYDIAVVRIGFEADASTYDPMLTEKGIGNANFAHYTDPELAELLDEAKATLDTDERMKLYEQVAEIVQSQVIYVPLYEYPDLWAQNANLEGEYRVNSVIEFGRFQWK